MSEYVAFTLPGCLLEQPSSSRSVESEGNQRSSNSRRQKEQHLITEVGEDELNEDDFNGSTAATITKPGVLTMLKGALPLVSSTRRRHVSLDEGSHRPRPQKGDDMGCEGSTPETKQRAYSVGSSSMMKALNFEEIDVDGTPLSSQRSCSEFLRFNSLNSQKLQLDFLNREGGRHEHEKKKKSSFFSYFFGRSKSAEPENPSDLSTKQTDTLNEPVQSGKRVQFMDEDEAAFLISQLRGAGARTESITRSTVRSSSSSQSQSNYSRLLNNSNSNYRRNSRSFDMGSPEFLEEPGCMDFVFGQIPMSENVSRPDPTFSSIRRGQKAILQESSLAIDLILGIRYGIKKRLPMEIELKTLEPRLHVESQSSATFSRSHSRSSFSGLNSRSSLSGMSELGSTSQHSLHSMSDRSETFLFDQQLRLEENNPAPGQLGFFTVPQQLTATSRVCFHNILKRCRENLTGPEDEAYYEQIRIQPFATGAYLRGMLVAGFASLFFNFYCLSMWPDYNLLWGEGAILLKEYHIQTERTMYAMLIIQLILNLFQLPLRISLHLNCWESSRTVEVDAAINLIRTMIQSDTWLLNRALGRVLDLLTIITLVGGEIYLCCFSLEDPLLPLVVSLCSTNLLAMFVRFLMSTVFALSMHDPQVLSDARRRGLSKWDLEVLPAFVFTSLKEVTNPECSICLASFDAGEMLISLPCDNKHSFHALCIRQWLERQNSCPLCQKLV